MNKKQNGFKQWFAALKTFQKVMFVVGGLVLFSIIGSIVDEEPQAPDETKEQVAKSDNVKEEKGTAEETESVEETETTEEPTEEVEAPESNDTSDEYYTQEEYFDNLTSYFLSVSSTGTSLASFGDELSATGEVTPEAEQYIQDAIDELEIGAYLISDEGMYLKVPKHLESFHQDVINVHEAYEAGILEIQEGSKTEDVDVMASGIEKVEEANLMLDDINVQLEEME